MKTLFARISRIQNNFLKSKSHHISDKNNDGEISASELTSGAEKAFKVYWN